mmetsp:Transcript_12142/g.30729  ORF Transcript_12142/g.30729 Transcript_12142/m.30729 type:complete len:110 (-) Transcript_12142:290-619(-)
MSAGIIGVFVFQYSEKIWRLPAEITESLSVALSVVEKEVSEAMESEESLDASGEDRVVLLDILGGSAVTVELSSNTVLGGENVRESKLFMVILEVFDMVCIGSYWKSRG